MTLPKRRWWVRIGFSVLSALSLPATALACPDFLNRLNSPILAQAPGNAQVRNLCDLYDQYHAALAALNPVTHGEAERIRVAFGPRFINYPDFVAPRAASVGYNPWFIYDPAPKTWQDWEDAQAYVQGISAANFVAAQQGTQPGLAPLDDNTLLHIHAAALEGLPRFADMFRTNEREIGRAYYRSLAMPAHAVNSALFPLDADSQPTADTRQLVTWTPTRCYEDMDSAERANADAVRVDALSQHPELTFQGTREGRTITLQCGFLQYPSPSLVPGLLQSWMNDINSYITTWFSANPKGDPILVASRAQRWFVSIHPFVGGNGRTSRFVMDYILTSLGLPPPILADMNMDLASTEQEWAARVASGLKQGLYLLNWCRDTLARSPNATACQLTSHQPGPRP